MKYVVFVCVRICTDKCINNKYLNEVDTQLKTRSEKYDIMELSCKVNPP